MCLILGCLFCVKLLFTVLRIVVLMVLNLVISPICWVVFYEGFDLMCWSWLLACFLGYCCLFGLVGGLLG